MLTADLVNARRYKGELRIVPLDERARGVALGLAAAWLAIAEASIGRSRDEFDEAADAVEVAPRDRRLGDGLRKLIEDRCDFGVDESIEPEPLRRAVFLEAAAARRALGWEARLDRDAVLARVGSAAGLDAAQVEHALYADLRGAQRLKSLVPITPQQLVDNYDLAQAQAVLLRAVRVTVDVACVAQGGYRALFAKLKFLRLLYTLAPRPVEEGGGYRLEIDGPFNLFESSTRYGLQLALALGALRECDAWSLDAEVRWGKERQALSFHLEGKSPAPVAHAPPRLADDVAALVAALGEADTRWRVSPATAILDLPGVGLCVPDLVFEKGRNQRVYLEVLGYWSRDAVWRRVELVEQGLGERILFAVSSHLRVSEAALDEEQPGALYVYKRALHARTILERVEALAARKPAARKRG